MPAGNSEQRKLAAIMFTDMVGYSALAQRDEKLALALLEEHRALLRPLFPKFNGTEIKTIGDAFLVEFHSALEAAQCGIEIQRALAKRNADTTADRRIELKIGIHIGDVVHRGGDVYGDGVNIASRIEPLAGAGGICVSMDVERQIRNALEARFEKLAPTELKNISVPMELFRIVLPWEVADEAKGERAKEKGTGSRRRESAHSEFGSWNAEHGTRDQRRLTSVATKWGAFAALVLIALGVTWWLVHQSGRATKQAASSPTPAKSPGRITSLAVKPLDDISGDTNQAYFSDGMTEALCASLGNLSALRVPGRSSVMRYKASTKSIPEMAGELRVDAILEGSVQRLVNRMVVTVQLVEAATDRHVWATNYNRDLSDFFAVQNELALAIANQIKIQVSPEERTRLAKTRHVPAAAQEAYLKGRHFYDKRSAENLGYAIKHFQEAIRIEPNYAAAHAGLGDAYGSTSVYGNAPQRDACFQARVEVEKALALDSDLAEAHASLGVLMMSCEWNFRAAETELKRAIALNPNYAPAHYWYALTLVTVGRNAECLAQAARAVEVDPLSAVAYVHLGWTEYWCRRYDQAIVALEKALALEPNYPGGLRHTLGCAYDQKGMAEKAFATWQAMFLASGASEAEIADRETAFKRSGIKGYWESFLTAGFEENFGNQFKAQIYARLGKKKEALAALEKAFEGREPGLHYWRCDPVYDGLRSEPEAIELSRKMGFEK